MIICLGPICFPVWHLIPVFFLLWGRLKILVYNLMGWPLPVEPTKDDGKKLEGTNAAIEQKEGSEGSELRRRKTTGGVSNVESMPEWKALQLDSANTGMALVVCFTAKWCKPCKAMAPLFEDLSNKYRSAVFVSVDVDALEEASVEAGVKAMPTYQVYRGSNKVQEVAGAYKDELERMLVARCSLPDA